MNSKNKKLHDQIAEADEPTRQVLIRRFVDVREETPTLRLPSRHQSDHPKATKRI